jgi:hypothetical protein
MTGEKPRPRVYVAADYRRKDEVVQLLGWLEQVGLEPCCRWALQGEEVSTVGELTEEHRAAANEVAQIDLADIRESSLLVQLTTGEKERGGRIVEFGYGLALDLTVVVCGPVETVFHFADGVHRVGSPAELLAWVRGWLAA